MYFDYHVPIVLTVQWDKYIEQYIFKGLSADFKQDLRMKISVWRCKWRFVWASIKAWKWAEFKFPECRGFEDS